MLRRPGWGLQLGMGPGSRVQGLVRPGMGQTTGAAGLKRPDLEPGALAEALPLAGGTSGLSAAILPRPVVS